MNLLNLESLVRMNQLVRGALQIDAFEDWWCSASRSEREALTYSLHFCAKQAGIEAWMIDEALQRGGLSSDEDGVREALKGTRRAMDAAAFTMWIPQASEESLRRAFRLALLCRNFVSSAARATSWPQ